MNLVKYFGQFLLVFGLMGCAPKRNHEDTSSGAIVKLPWYDSQTGYTFQWVQLRTLRNISKGSGEIAFFKLSPGFGGTGLTGDSPRLRVLQNSEGNYIPIDTLSSQTLSIYAHLERLFDIDQAIGVDKEISWPRQVGIQTVVRSDLGQEFNNAFVLNEQDVMIFTPYNAGNTPLPINGGVIAHEHFHSIFYQLVQKRQSGSRQNLFGFSNHLHSEGSLELSAETQSAGEKYFSILIRGVNEGLADVWGYLYTGDPAFVGQSLDFANLDRSLKSEASFDKLKSTSDVASEVTSSADRAMGFSYELGTQLARAFYQWYVRQKELNPGRTALTAGDLRLHIVKVLKLLSEDIKTLAAEDTLPASIVWTHFADSLDHKSDQECTFFRSIISSEELHQGTFSCSVQN